ncbi:hypothetical protein CPB86DRAFT_250313 [Serendipita vermifera]|nr:hypothetical protein CPB86DRAFT_250313 [Serendipita vermifera]
MQFKTAIILSIVSTASTTTFAAPIDSRVSELSRRDENIHYHYARDFNEAPKIEARNPSPDEELEIRSPPPSQSYPQAHSFELPGIVASEFKEPRSRRNSRPPPQSPYAHSLSGSVQQLETRSPSELTRAKADKAILEYVRKNGRKKDLVLPERYNSRGEVKRGQSRKSARSLLDHVQRLKARSPSLSEELKERSPLELSMEGLKTMMASKGESGFPNYLLKGADLLQQYRESKAGVNAKVGGVYSGRPQSRRSLPEDVQLKGRSLFYELEEIDD